MAVRTLRRLNTNGLPEDFELPEGLYGFGVSWDDVPGQPKVDIDLQCVVVDSRGIIIDCAYYNNLNVLGSIVHSGDEPTGAAAGIDEVVWVSMDRLPEHVALLIFVVAAYSGGQLKDADNGMLHVLEKDESREIARFQMEHSAAGVDIVGAMFRSGLGWALRIIDEPGQEGQHFMDILPQLSQVIRGFLPDAPKRQKIAFAVEKGGMMDLPQKQDSVTIGLGWDVAEQGVDLDVSAVLLDADGCVEEVVFYGRLESKEHGVRHSGDNLTGEGDGDDEQIVANLSSIGASVQQVVFVINIFTQGVTFDRVSNAYCRVVDGASENELCRYCLREAGAQNGLIVSKISREVGGRWGFHAIGNPCRGRTHQDSLPEIKSVCCPQLPAAMPSVAPRVPDNTKWTCTKCDEVNKRERPQCNNCGARKPGS